MIRDLRRADAPRVFELLTTQFPREEAILGSRPEGFERIVRRILRWDTRFVVRLARLFGRPIYRFFVVEEDRRVVATTLLTFLERSAYVSHVVVEPAYRRRGYARALLERARETTGAVGRSFLALDVLAENAPARALYERTGYRPLRESAFLVREPGTPRPAGPRPAVRAFRAPDAPALAEVARRSVPPEVQQVLPVRAAALLSSGAVNRILESEMASWVVDRGQGPEAYLAAVASPATDAGFCSDPIVGEGVEPRDATALVGTAVGWLAAHGAPRVVTQVPKSNARGRAALEGEGFHEALALWTLYRRVA